jgi:membrane protein
MPFSGSTIVLSIVNWLVSVVVIALLFALLFKYLPDAEISWHQVRLGAIVTALLFVAGEAVVGIYIGHAGIANGYGAAGSLVVLLVWVYYSAMLLLFGAEFTRTYAESLTTPAT